MEALGSAASIVSIIQITGSIIKICSGYVGEVKGAKKDIQYLIKVVEDLRVVLRKLHSLLDGENGQKLPITQVLSRTILECQRDLEKLNKKLDITRPGEKNPGNQKRDKFVSYFDWRSIKWPFERKEVEKIVTRIEKYKRVFLTALQLDLVDVTVRMDRKVDLAKLPTVDEAAFDSYMDQHENECLEQTRKELLHDILAWSADINSKYIFWLNGMAGTGKSTIARTVARLLKEEKRLGASFFFKRGEGDRGNSTQFFTTIVKQLVGQFPPLGPPVAKAVEDDPAIGKKSLREQFHTLLLQPLSQLECRDHGLSSLVIVIDALDECEKEQDIRTILHLLPSIKSSGLIRLRVFITSRPELPIRLGFKQIHDDDHRDTVLHEIPEGIIQHDLMAYFQFRLSVIREEHALPDGWPGEDITRTLVRMAIPLFIFAATICRFIGDLRWEPDERLEIIMRTRLKDDTTPLERTYTPILNNLLSGATPRDSEQLVNEFQRIVGVIIILESPLSIFSLGQLLEIPTQKIGRRLELFHSVLNVPRDENQPVRLLHLSFRDFLLDPGRKNNVFWVDGKESHRKIAVQCLTLMRRLLRKNICDLPHDGFFRDEIDEQKKQDCLPMELQYACRYWIHHLQEGNIRDRDLEDVEGFLREHLLHWLEALSILAHSSESISGLVLLQSITQNDSELFAFLYDARRFVLNCISIIDSAPLQLYCSALVFAPEKSQIRLIFKDNIPNWIQRLPKVDTSWGALQQTLEIDGFAPTVAFSTDGKLVASADWDTIKLWDATSGLVQQAFRIRKRPSDPVAFSPDCKLIASMTSKSVTLWDTTSGLWRQVFECHHDRVSRLAFSPNGKLVALAADETINLWNVTSGLIQKTLKGHTCKVAAVAFSLDGKLIASIAGETIKLWDSSSGLILHTIEDRGFAGKGEVAFSPDIKLVASCSENIIELWDVNSGPMWQAPTNHGKLPVTPTFSPNGKLIASGSDHGIINLWDATSGLILATLRAHTAALKALAFSPNSESIASAATDGTVKLWDTTSVLTQKTIERHSSPVATVVLSPNNKLIASTFYDQTVKMWDIASGLVQQTFEGWWEPGRPVQWVAFSPDSKLIASVSSKNTTVKLWDVASGLVQQTFENDDDLVNAVAFSPNGKLVSVVSDQTVKLWDITSGLIHQDFPLYADETSTIESVAFSHDTKLIALVSSDKTIKLWDITSGLIRPTLSDHSQAPAETTSLAFSHDGTLLSSSDPDEPIKLWDITSGTVKLNITFDALSSMEHGTSLEGAWNLWEEEWVIFKGIPRLWLPLEYRPSCSCISRSTGTLILGHFSGRVSFLAFDLDCF